MEPWNLVDWVQDDVAVLAYLDNEPARAILWPR